MSVLEFDAVEAAFAGMHGAYGEVVGDFLDVLDLHLLRHFAEEAVGNGARGKNRQA